MKTHKIKTYEFDELSDEAQDKAIWDHIEFLLDCVDYEHGSDNYKKAIMEADRMKTPWFTGSYVYEYCKDEIIEEIKAGDYEFYKDGSMFNFKGMG